MKKKLATALICGVVTATSVSPVMGGENSINSTIANSSENWEDKLLVVVDDDSNLNVRSDDSKDSKVVGKMCNGSVATVISKESEWTKIKSGDVEGYVRNDFCVFGEEAEKLAYEMYDIEAIVTGDNVRVRSDSHLEADIHTLTNKGDSFKVLDGQDGNEWIAIEYEDSVAYIYKDYVEIGLNLKEAEKVVVKKHQSTSSTSKYSGSYFKKMGVINWNGYRWTYYSQRVLPGGGLKIPGRHVDENGYVCDENNYICIASNDLKKGTVISTPFGKSGKVYDCGCASGTVDVYVAW